MHSEVQRIYVINHHGAIAECPLGRRIIYGDLEFIILGSIDITDSEFSDKPLVNWIDVIDFKSASDWTFPKDIDDKNPTHFDQTKIYTFILFTFTLNSTYNKIRDIKVVYMGKHNLYTGEQIIKFNMAECASKYSSFIQRCSKLHMALIQKKLPDKEPMKWCSMCDYRSRCEANVISMEDVPSLMIKEVRNLYSKETGKSPMWRGKETKGFEKFKYRFKIDSY